MSRDKQIEEMANIMKMSLDGLGSGTHNVTGFEISTMFAKALYNASYRKVPEGAIVLTRAELDALNEYTEKLKREYAKEIFAEIEEKGKVDEPIVEYYILSYSELAELKKKYTEEGK